MGDTKMIPLPAAAFRLRLPWMKAYDLVLRGRLTGEQRGARWWVRESDVARVERECEPHNEGE